VNTPWQVISLLESDNSRLAKEAVILAEAESNNTDFFEGCRLALDSMITFGLKQIPEKKDEDGPGLDWNNFTVLSGNLRNRNLTGNAARDAVAEAVKQATTDQWNNWYRRILIKDLRCGVSEKTVNNVVGKKFKQYAVPVFSCQLAHGSEGHENKMSGKKYIEVKLDGVRVITIVYPTGGVDQFSRNGKELVNFPHIKDQIGSIASQFTEPMVLDGEVMSSSFQDLMKQVHRKSNVQSNDAVLHLFDILPLSSFEKGGWNETQEKRSEQVYKWHKDNKDALPNVAVVGHELVDLDTDVGQLRYKEINAQAVAGGYEGIMIKDPNGPYECKRTASWLKLKPFIEVSLSVVATEEGTGKHEGRLGAFVCEGVDDGKDIRVNVGSGLTDEQRVIYWENADSIIGDIVEVRADAITQNQDGTYSLRFPRFLHFRGFVSGEKL
jgi:DNA ligase-1